MILEIIGLIISLIVLMVFGFGVTGNSNDTYSPTGGFMDLNQILNADNAITDIVDGHVNYRNIHNELVANTHEESPCNKDVVWGPATGLHKSCVYIKKTYGAMSNPDYRFVYKLRDLLTTIYVRSFEEKTRKMKQNTRSFSLQLAATFNDGLTKLITVCNRTHNTHYRPEQARVVYKGGNVIATYTRMLFSRMKTQSEFVSGKLGELKRGDWDYSLSLDNVDPDFESFARTIVLFMLQGIKAYMDDGRVFQSDDISMMIQRDLLNSSDANSIVSEYSQSIKKQVSIESVTNHMIITRDKISPTESPDLYSKYTLKRDYMPIRDTFDVNTLVDHNYPMLQTSISIGFIEKIESRKSHLVTSFDLARVKINNKAMIKINGVMQTKNLSADLIDMSFINRDDTYYTDLHNRISAIGRAEWTIRRVNGLTIPYLTSHYLFYDLSGMLVESCVYPWDDKKYGKRLDRLIVMGIVSSLTINSSSRDLVKCMRVVIGIAEQIDVENMTTSVKILSNATIKDGTEFNLKLVYNHFTYMLLKSIFNVLILYKFVNNNASLGEIAYVHTLLRFVFTGESDEISESSFMNNGVDLPKYKQYCDHIVNQLKVYVDLFSKSGDITLNDTDPIFINEV